MLGYLKQFVMANSFLFDTLNSCGLIMISGESKNSYLISEHWFKKLIKSTSKNVIAWSRH